ncbi:MAG: hypothetical protein V4567_04230 [Pseudomonadota bacterium]
MSQHSRKLALAALFPFACIAAAATPHGTQGDVPDGYSTTITGGVHDFDYFMDSGWTTYQHRIKTEGDGKLHTDNLVGYLCALPYLDGTATVDELYFPAKRTAGLTLRLFNPKTRQWSIYWVSSTDNVLDANPVVGGFKGNRGLFYGTDTDTAGRTIKVRFIWTLIDHDHARWEQAIAHDDGKWVTNWTADFLRTDRDKICTTGGRPRR